MKVLIILMAALILTGCGDKNNKEVENNKVNNDQTNEVIKEDETLEGEDINNQEQDNQDIESSEKMPDESNKTEDKNTSSNSTNSDATSNNNNNTSNKNNTSSNNSTTSTQSTINLVGTWKLKDDKSYYVFNADGTGKVIDDRLSETIEYNITWSLKGLNLTTKFPGYESQFGGTSKIVVYNNDSFNLDTKKNLVYNRYTGSLPNRKIYQKMVNFNVRYANMPIGLEFVYGYSETAQYYMSASNQELLNQTYEMTIDLASCGVGSCTIKPQFNIPDGMSFSSSVVDLSYELRKKIIQKDVKFQTTYINLTPGLEVLADNEGKTDITGTVKSDDINKINNAKYTAVVDLSACPTEGQCENAKVTYKIEGEGVEMMYGNNGTYSLPLVKKN